MEKTQIILEKLERIEAILSKTVKPILTVEDLVDYTGFKRSYIYKLVHLNEIPYSKPQGKVLFFDREEIDDWLRRNKSQSKSQIEERAINYFLKKK